MARSTARKPWFALVLAVTGAAIAVFIWAMLDPYDTLGLHYRLTGWRGRGRARIHREIRRNVTKLESQVRQGDKSVETLVRLAAAYELASKYEEALGTVDKVLSIDPAHQRARSIQMHSLLELERYDEVQRLADRYTFLYPTDSGAAWVLVDLYSRKGHQIMAELAEEYGNAVKSGRDMPRWSEFCAERGHPIWPEEGQEVPRIDRR